MQAASVSAADTGIQKEVVAAGEYSNWEGVSNISQFLDANGNYCFAYDNGDTVIVKRTSKDGSVKKTIKLKKKHGLFGAVTSDDDGCYYLVTGEANSGSDTSKETVFISKYDSSGKHVKTIGDNGSSSLAYFLDSSYHTMTPFDGGNCDAAVNGKYVAVNYARKMYSGHQSNSVWIIDKDSMKTVSLGDSYSKIYSSHSFGQRAISYGDGFAFMSQGDCYSIAFTYTGWQPSENPTSSDIFHFWVSKDALNNWDMWTLNNTFADIGDMSDLGNGNISFVGASVKALSSKAANQNEQLFIQIFDPTADLSKAAAYKTSGKRSGTGGPNGDEKVTDYGVKWLTSYSDKTIIYPQAVSDGKGNTIILFELFGRYDYSYKGVYYCKVDKNGKVTKKIARCSKDAYLNPCETPVYTNGRVYWTGNKYGDQKNEMYVYSFKL